MNPRAALWWQQSQAMAKSQVGAKSVAQVGEAWGPRGQRTENPKGVPASSAIVFASSAIGPWPRAAAAATSVLPWQGLARPGK